MLFRSKEFIQDLVHQGYEYLSNLNSAEALLANARVQLQSLNNVVFADAEWNRFVEEYLDKPEREELKQVKSKNEINAEEEDDNISLD